MKILWLGEHLAPGQTGGARKQELPGHVI